MQASEVRQPLGLPVGIGVGTLALGVGLGFVAPALARWLMALVEQTPLPVHGVIRLLGDLSPGWSLGILSGLGLAGGVFLALATIHEAPTLVVAGDHLEHRQEDRDVWVQRADVGAMYRDRDHLVVLTPDSGQRARISVDTLRKAEVRTALEQHEWPLLDADPYDSAFLPWKDGRPEFSAAEHALLRDVWEKRKDKAARRAAEDKVTTAGLVVRVRDGKLQVRRASGAAMPEDVRGTEG